MDTWCTSYEINKDDPLFAEVKRKKSIFKEGLFSDDIQVDFAPVLFSLGTDGANDDDVDRVLAYSVPSETLGQMVYFYITKLRQTVMSVRGVLCCLNLRLVPDTFSTFSVAFLSNENVIQGRIELPVDIEDPNDFDSKEQFKRLNFTLDDRLKTQEQIDQEKNEKLERTEAKKSKMSRKVTQSQDFNAEESDDEESAEIKMLQEEFVIIPIWKKTDEDGDWLAQ